MINSQPLVPPCTNGIDNGVKISAETVTPKSILEQNRDVVKHYMKAYAAFSKLYNNDVIYSNGSLLISHTLSNESLQNIEKYFMKALEHNTDIILDASFMSMYTDENKFNFDKEKITTISCEFAFAQNNNHTGYAYLIYKPLYDMFYIALDDLLAEDKYANILCKDNILAQTLLNADTTSKQFAELLKQVKKA